MSSSARSYHPAHPADYLPWNLNIPNLNPSLNYSIRNSPHPASRPVVPASLHQNSRKKTPPAAHPETETASPHLESAEHSGHSYSEHWADSEQPAAQQAAPPDTGTVAPHSTAPACPAPPGSSTSSSTSHHCPSTTSPCSSYSRHPESLQESCPPAPASTEDRSVGSLGSAHTPDPLPAPTRPPPATIDSYLY